ncbi:MAG: hypothetical protein KY476_00535 [Planctomycetes bacterium]|nr:hypothetical protein [Planctomycetota bacterium]
MRSEVRGQRSEVRAKGELSPAIEDLALELEGMECVRCNGGGCSACNGIGYFGWSPDAPLDVPPGPERVPFLAARYQAGRPLFHEDDPTFEDLRRKPR